MAHPRKPLSKCKIVGDIVEVELINTDKVTICDAKDFGLVSKHRWRMNGSGYAITYINRNPVGMHRLISNCPDGMEVDHINRERLDNRRSNLRICTKTQNAINQGLRSSNSSGYTGVRKHGTGWQAFITADHKQILLGTFRDIEDAYKARLDAEKKYHAPLIEAMQQVV